jgi:acetyl esterase/lipase
MRSMDSAGGHLAAAAAEDSTRPPPSPAAAAADSLPVLDSVLDYEKIHRVGEGTYGVVYKGALPAASWLLADAACRVVLQVWCLNSRDCSL